MRLHGLDGIAAAVPLLAADRHRQIGALAGHFLDLLLERGALRAAWGIALDRLVPRKRDVRDGIHSGSLPAVSDVSGGIPMVPRLRRSAASRPSAGHPPTSPRPDDFCQVGARFIPYAPMIIAIMVGNGCLIGRPARLTPGEIRVRDPQVPGS